MGVQIAEQASRACRHAGTGVAGSGTAGLRQRGDRNYRGTGAIGLHLEAGSRATT